MLLEKAGRLTLSLLQLGSIYEVFHVLTALTCSAEKHKTIILIGVIIGIILATVYYIKLMNFERDTHTHHHDQPNSL